MKSLKKALKKTQLGKLVKRMLRGTSAPKPFSNSGSYWEERYKANDDSGAGSYGRLADFKAKILNDFVAKNHIDTVIEYGSGDGNQLTLATYPFYKGFDVSATALKLCKNRFKGDASKEFYAMSDASQSDAKASLTLSLDVLYHLVEDAVFDSYMERLFTSSTQYVIIYSSNYDDHFAPHVKSREFTKWVDANVTQSWELKEHIKNKYPFDPKDPDNTSMADFYIYQRK